MVKEGKSRCEACGREEFRTGEKEARGSGRKKRRPSQMGLARRKKQFGLALLATYRALTERAPTVNPNKLAWRAVP